METFQQTDQDPEGTIDYVKEVSDELSKKLGRRVSLLIGKTGGKITLDYYSDNDREVLINLLRSLKK